MKRRIWLWQAVGFGVTALGGTLLHFLYDWLGEAVWVAPFSAVNESTWEHMKIFFWPTLIFAILQSFFFKERKDFWCVKLRGIILGILLIPLLFYTYNGVVGRSPDWLNIAIFFLSAAISYIYEVWLFRSEELNCESPRLTVALLLTIGLFFIVFTFATPEIGLFKDPLTGTYGI